MTKSEELWNAMRKFMEIFLTSDTDIADGDALAMKVLHPKWEAGHDYKTGDRFKYNGDLYRVLQNHTSQDAWTPGSGTESLYVRIDDTHVGTAADPIPYSGNMELVEGLYYTQVDVVYKCIRSTGAPVYNALADLIGIYVKVAE